MPPTLSSGAQAAFDVLATILVGLQVAILVAVTPTLFRLTRKRMGRGSILLVGGIQGLVLAHGVYLASGLQASGLVPELAAALWFAVPLALLAFAAWPPRRNNPGPTPDDPLRWILIAFPFMLLLAALARIDFFHLTGFRLPTAVNWLFTYLPTFAGVFLAVAGWLAVRGIRSSRPFNSLDVYSVLVAGFAVALVTALLPTTAFILSATITFGSGYQLFTAPPPLPPLSVSLFLVSLAGAALAATLISVRANLRSMAIPLLALSAVLSGIFPVARSVLGVLVALQLLILASEG